MPVLCLTAAANFGFSGRIKHTGASFYRAIFKSESRRRSAVFKVRSNHASFLGYSSTVFPFLSVIRTPDGSTSSRLAFGSIKIVLLNSNPMEESIRLMRPTISVRKTNSLPILKQHLSRHSRMAVYVGIPAENAQFTRQRIY